MSARFRMMQRVQLHPATDLWMRGARYGQIIAGRRTREWMIYVVELDVDGRKVRLLERDLMPLE